VSSELADCSYIGPWCCSYDLDLIDRRGIDKVARMKRPKQKSYGAGVAAMTFCYTFNFGATRPTTPWLYPTEVIPLNFRARVDGVWSVVGWKIGNGIITMLTLFLFQAISYGTLLLLLNSIYFACPSLFYSIRKQPGAFSKKWTP
jgi:hypothetical protein